LDNYTESRTEIIKKNEAKIASIKPNVPKLGKEPGASLSFMSQSDLLKQESQSSTLKKRSYEDVVAEHAF
jgi:hypothetical protein